MLPSVFIIDDDPDQLSLLETQLRRSHRYEVHGFTSADEALSQLEVEPPDAVVCDLRMPGMDGLEFTRRLRRSRPSLPVLVITARGGVEDALRAGANDFVAKPVDTETLLTRLGRCLQAVPAQELLSSVAKEKFDPHGIVGSHPLVQAVRAFVRDVAEVPQVPVLLLGESGTGKNLVARAIHGAGASTGRFVEVNCAALPPNLLEAELFGYEKGAFTDARQTKKGLVEAADGGTLFLDEIGSIPFDLQAKLLTFLESRSFRRVGSTRDLSVQLRVIAATNADLAAEVARGGFREDLYYRLNVAVHVLPPLRRIDSDLPVLVRHFVERAARYFSKPVPEVDAASVRRLQEHRWPGNARELRNLVERSMIFAKGPVIRIAEPAGAAPSAASVASGVILPRGLTLQEVEKRYIAATLEDAGGNISEAAEQLGITRKVLWLRRKQNGLEEMP